HALLAVVGDGQAGHRERAGTPQAVLGAAGGRHRLVVGVLVLDEVAPVPPGAAGPRLVIRQYQAQVDLCPLPGTAKVVGAGLLALVVGGAPGRAAGQRRGGPVGVGAGDGTHVGRLGLVTALGAVLRGGEVAVPGLVELDRVADPGDRYR